MPLMPYCLTYFRVIHHGRLELGSFCKRLGLDAEALLPFFDGESLEIGRCEVYDVDMNVMIRKTLAGLLGREDELAAIKRELGLEYYLERVPVLLRDGDGPRQILSLDDDIIRFMAKAGVCDDLDYYIH